MGLPGKLLLAIQFWKGDRDQAMSLARLIADLEKTHNTEADLLFISRFDCSQDQDTVDYCSKKFNVRTHINRARRGVGWPTGCNDLAFGAMDYFYDVQNRVRPPYKAMLLIEADACPLAPGWIERLSEAWNVADARLVGPVVKPGPVAAGGEHLNGNCMLSGDPKFLHWFTRKLVSTCRNGGWDYVLAPQFKRIGWRNCSMMRSHWGAKTMAEEQIKELQWQGVVWLHGVKDYSVQNFVRKVYL